MSVTRPKLKTHGADLLHWVQFDESLLVCRQDEWTAWQDQSPTTLYAPTGAEVYLRASINIWCFPFDAPHIRTFGLEITVYESHQVQILQRSDYLCRVKAGTILW